ncbi:MAG: hypothetical protein HZA01_14010 [Nitrospinae bacterium]|nr:hypothetical protein [Nitrospinota bacterium]
MPAGVSVWMVPVSAIRVSGKKKIDRKERREKSLINLIVCMAGPKISINKIIQGTNKEIGLFWAFGNCNLFVIWDLNFFPFLLRL